MKKWDVILYSAIILLFIGLVVLRLVAYLKILGM